MSCMLCPTLFCNLHEVRSATLVALHHEQLQARALAPTQSCSSYERTRSHFLNHVAATSAHDRTYSIMM